ADEGPNVVALQPPTATETLQLDEEHQVSDLRPEELDKPGCTRSCTAGCEHIVDDRHPLPGTEGIGMNIELTFAVLEAVFDRHAGRRQLARLPDRYERQAESGGDWRD